MAKKTKPPESNRAILYVRCSTAEQSESGLGLESQRSKIRTYASLYGLEIVREISDEGESAKSLARSGIQEALKALLKGEAECLVVARLDRLTRSLKDWQALIEQYFGPERPYRLMSVADQIDTRSASGRLVLNMLLSVAQWERETISERTKAALAVKKDRGERVGQIPFGMRLAADKKTLLRHPDEQRTLAEMRSLAEQSYSYQQIADILNDEGYQPRGKKWIKSTIARMLSRI